MKKVVFLMVIGLAVTANGANIALQATPVADSQISAGAGAQYLNDGTLDNDWASSFNNSYSANDWSHWASLTWSTPVRIDSVNVGNYYWPGINQYVGNWNPREFNIESWDGSQWVVQDHYSKLGSDITRWYLFTPSSPIVTTALRINIIVPSGDVYDYIHGLNAVEGTHDFSVNNYQAWLANPNNDDSSAGFNAMPNGYPGLKTGRIAEIQVEGASVPEPVTLTLLGLGGLLLRKRR